MRIIFEVEQSPPGAQCTLQYEVFPDQSRPEVLLRWMQPSGIPIEAGHESAFSSRRDFLDSSAAAIFMVTLEGEGSTSWRR